MVNPLQIPQIKDIEKAIEIYYSRLDLSNADIKELFGDIGRMKIGSLKKIADGERRRQNGFSWSANRVPTVYAFAAWNLDIKDLEQRAAAMQKFKRRGISR